jgi:predicted nucleic acid-binding protein
LKGAVDTDSIEVLAEAIMSICMVVWLDNIEILSMGAKLSHGLGIHAGDALILSCFVLSDAKTIYTTDSHVGQYKKKGVTVINLAQN